MIDPLKEYWDKLLEDMQKPGVREKMQEAFNATPEELGEALREYMEREKREKENDDR